MSHEAADTPDVGAAGELIETAWHDSALEMLLAGAGTEERHVAQKQYVVALLARLEWEGGQPAMLNATAASRLNELYCEGLRETLTRVGMEPAVGELTADARQWRHYVRAAIHPAIELRRGVDLPGSYLELLGYLRSGAAWFAR